MSKKRNEEAMTFEEKLERFGASDAVMQADFETEVEPLRALVVVIGQEIEAERNPFAHASIRKDFAREYERIQGVR